MIRGNRNGLACITGRFQPVHQEHLEVFLSILDRHDRLIVAITNPDPTTRIGDPANSSRHTASDNPFTYFERLQFISAALSGEGVSSELYDLVPFPLHIRELVTHYVPLHIPQYVRVFSEWEERKIELLSSYGYDVVRLEPIDEKRCSGTLVRSRLTVSEEWKALVPHSVIGLIESCLEAIPLTARDT